MSLRTRLVVAFAAIVLVPMALLAFGLRQDVTRRLSREYEQRLHQVVDTMRGDLTRESAAIAERLASLERALRQDNRFRAAAVAGVESEREYLLDYAGSAMRLTGLSMLQIQDEDGRILSSGHFRNEHGRLDAGLAGALLRAGDVVLVTARSAEKDFLALARAQRFQLADRSFTIVGGVIVDEAFLSRLARDRAIVVSLTYPGGTLTTGDGASGAGDVAVGPLVVPFVPGAAEHAAVAQARFEVTQSMAPLRSILRSADSWFMLTALGTGIAALALAVWISARMTSRLTALAERTAVLDLDRLDVEFDAGSDEVGHVSRLLGDLASRLRTSTTRVREAERRATIGELARQINHDIKNGLIPLRNVMRHLAQVERDQPEALAAVFADRRATMDSSVAYLETLATSYQRLSPPQARRDCDLNAVIDEVVHGARGHDGVEFATDLSATAPRVMADPIALRRIVENLTANAVDSLEGRPGGVTLSTRIVESETAPPLIQFVVADTGRGMSKDEASRIFNDFYTTKPGGTGLGLSIVRRLVMDLDGTLRVESTPGTGSRMIIEMPRHA